MSVFGWSYPPGCSGPPDDDDRITAAQESLWDLCEAAGLDVRATERVLEAFIKEENAVLAARYDEEAAAMAAEYAAIEATAAQYWKEQEIAEREEAMLRSREWQDAVAAARAELHEPTTTFFDLLEENGLVGLAEAERAERAKKEPK